MFVRLHFSRLDNSGFQEPVFSISGLTMSGNPSQMTFDLFEKRTLLLHNKELIKKEIS